MYYFPLIPDTLRLVLSAPLWPLLKRRPRKYSSARGDIVPAFRVKYNTYRHAADNQFWSNFIISIRTTYCIDLIKLVKSIIYTMPSKLLNPLTAKDELFSTGNLTFLKSLDPRRVAIHAPFWITLCPNNLPKSAKSVKILHLKTMFCVIR